MQSQLQRNSAALPVEYAEKAGFSFPWFRFYGPEKALMDKSWTMPDIEMVE
jgi:hypothetical protein